MDAMPQPEFKITKSVLNRIEHHAKLGLTQEQIAHIIGVGPTTLSEKKQDHPEIQEAISRGRAKTVGALSSSLLESSKSSVQAQIFALKNLSPESWSERQQPLVNVNLGRLSDSQLLDEIRQDPAMTNALGGFLEQDTNSNTNP
jgi:DNA-binding XRE family transcriptional regulator|tara:strand:+ start:327 stop:758 length:432 start_codon:yes stop_codon:yes gene_type:complete